MKNVKTPIIALIMITALLWIWNHGSKNSVREQTQQGQQQGQDIFKKQVRRNRNNAISDLRYAYTGNWQKNNIVAEAGQFSFPTPAVVKAATAAKKAVAKKAAAKKVATKSFKKYRYYTGPSPRFTSSTKDNDTISGTANVLPTNLPMTPLAAAAVTDTKKSAQDYLKQILATKSIAQLVSDFKSHKTDAATFYSVINSLLATSDTNPALRILGYQAMGQVSRSMQSFLIIATHKNLEVANVQQAAQADLNAYANINYIPTLNSLLANNNDSVRITAAQVIQTVVTQVLGVGTSNNHGGTVAAQQYVQLFNSVLTNLNNLLQSGRLNSQVSMAFSSTRNTLQQFLG